MTEANQLARNLEEVKELNLSRIIKFIYKSGVCSRSQLSEMSGLKQSTVTNIVNQLIDCGIVMETGSFAGKKGRRSIGVTIDCKGFRVISVRLTRTSYFVGRFCVDGKIDDLVQRPIAPEDPVERILLDIEKDIRYMIDSSSCEIMSIGMAVPGPFFADKSRILLITGARKWENINFRESLCSKFDIPFCIEHDANAGVMAEWWYGAKKLEFDKTYLYIAASYGIGAGLLTDGKVFHGAMGIAGEIGHMSINYNGPLCPCGNRGCLGMYVSTSAICREISKAAKNDGAKDLPSECDFNDAVAAYNAGHPAARASFAKSAEFLGAGIANLAYAFNPDIIFIGDEVVRNDTVYLAQVQSAFKNRVLPDIYKGTELRLCSFTQDPALIGSAALAVDWSFQHPLHMMELAQKVRL